MTFREVLDYIKNFFVCPEFTRKRRAEEPLDYLSPTKTRKIHHSLRSGYNFKMSHNDIIDLSVQRTPPPPETFQEPERDGPDPAQPQILVDDFTNAGEDTFGALSLDNNINNYKNSFTIQNNSSDFNRSKSNLDQVYHSRLTKQQNNRENILPNINKATKTGNGAKFTLQRQSSCKDVPERGSKAVQTQPNSIKHSVSEVNINKGSMTTRTVNSRKNSFSKPTRKTSTSVPNVAKISNSNITRTTERNLVKAIHLTGSETYVNTRVSPDESPSNEEEEENVIPVPVDRPVGLDFNDFLPKNHNTLGFTKQLPDMSEAEVVGDIMRGFEPIVNILNTRQRSMKLIMAQYRSKDMKTAVESALSMDDTSVLVDLLSVINSKYSLWNLDMCVEILPKMKDLLQSKYETYVTTGCNTVKFIVKHFGSVIRTNVQAPVGSFGVDISREERYRKAMKCHEHLMTIKSFLAKKQTGQGSNAVFREVYSLMQTCFD